MHFEEIPKMTYDKNAMARALEKVRTEPSCRIDDAAIVLGISRGQAYKAAEAGQIETMRSGKRWIVITAPLRRRLCIDAA
jgi:hypothetical protein